MSIKKAANLLRSSRNTVVFSGAGISTPSGIPDFRSESNGLWNKFDPMEVASLTAFRQNPDRFYNWFRPLARKMITAHPNLAHTALANLEKEEFIKTVITQNIDGLHQRAGSASVFEIHGSLSTLTCENCNRTFEVSSLIEKFIEEEIIPVCPNCGNTLKPDIILLGEQLPAGMWVASHKAAREAEVMLIVGSSLEVVPAAGLPMETLRAGGRIIIINHTATYIDDRAEVVINADVAKILPQIADELI